MTAKLGRPILTDAQMLEFLSTHVRRDGDCLLWAGSTHADGYPVVSWDRTRYMARALLLCLSGVAMHSGWCTWATCGERLCMARGHLRCGARSTMIRWHARQGSMQSSVPHSIAIAKSQSGTARMPMREARMVADMRLRGMKHKEIAAHYGVHRSAVGHALDRWSRIGVI